MLKENVIQVLESYEATLIHFSLFGVTVNGSGYKNVAKKIADNRASVVKSSRMGNNIEGFYYDGSDIFKFRHNQPNSRKWKSSVIHEATHALVDLKRIIISRVDSEVLAYTAQCIYLRRSNYDFSHAGRNPTILHPSLDLADSIIQGRGISPILVSNLQNAIKIHPQYIRYGSNLTTSNGI